MRSGVTQPPSLQTVPCGERFGRYTLLGRLASDGIADVFAAQLEGEGGLRKRVAIKRMRSHQREDEPAVQTFLEEAKLGARLSHPNISEVYELSQLGDEYFLAMEYLQGVTLADLLTACARNGRSLPIAVAVGILAQACAGLHFAHERKDFRGNSLCVLHRGVSPQSLFVREDGVVKVLDFAIARTRDSRHRGSTRSLQGKSGYTSPEQLRGKPLDRRTDVWSLGVVLFESLTSSRLFRGSSSMETVYATANQPIPPLSALCPEAPLALGDVVARALCREREWRFASAEQLRVAMLTAMGSGGVASPSEIGSCVRELCGAMLAERERIFEPPAAVVAEADIEHEHEAARGGPAQPVLALDSQARALVSRAPAHDAPQVLATRPKRGRCERVAAFSSKARLLRVALIGSSVALGLAMLSVGHTQDAALVAHTARPTAPNAQSREPASGATSAARDVESPVAVQVGAPGASAPIREASRVQESRTPAPRAR